MTILSGALVALMLAFASAGSARAGCTFDDLLNNLEDAVGAITSAECAAACSNGAGCGAVVAITGALAGVSASGQGKVDQFCSEARGILSDVNAGHDDAVTVGGLLNKLGVSAGLAQDIAQGLSDVASPLGIASCACSMEQGLGQVFGDLGSCVQEGLCDLDDLLGFGGCKGPEPIEIIDCTQQDFFGGSNIWGPPCKDGVCSERQYGNLGYSGMACFCPPPMRMRAWGVGGFCTDTDAPCWRCQCPQGSTPAGTTGGLAYTCLCPDGTPVSSEGTCFPPCQCNCPNNQILKSSSRKSDGTCNCNCGCPADRVLKGGPSGRCELPPCATGQTRLPNGKCCLVSQVTSCGDCCPAGKKPNANQSAFVDTCEITVQATPSKPIPNMTPRPTETPRR